MAPEPEDFIIPAPYPGLGNSTTSNDHKSMRYELDHSATVRSIGPLRLRGKHDNLPQDWWFASTAIPLLAATQGPLSNVFSIAALVTPWRVVLPNNGELPEGTDDNGVGIKDPQWEITLNAVSLTCGFIGNLLLLLHFVGRVRYIVALPLSIVFWLLASGILIAITSSLSIHDPARAPGEIYSQGFWHAVLASITYMVGAIMLIVNMVGYLRGHYPQNFDLDDDQRTLILQTMMFMIWLAGGAAIFNRLEGWDYANALYFCDIPSPTILTIGFGDLAPSTDAARGFLFVYELIGIIFLGLVIGSISRFASNISADKIIKKHQARSRLTTFGRSVTSENELRERLGLPPRRKDDGRRNSLARYGNLKVVGKTVTFEEHKAHVGGGGRGGAGRNNIQRPLSRDAKMRAKAQGLSAHRQRQDRRKKLLLLPGERDRFNTMREIQDETRRFKQYWSLAIAVLAFALLWLIGALGFMLSEARLLDMTYFQSLYFCFVALLTIGYGDISPKSNIGKPFFIVWSLIAVPTLTVLIQQMSSTVAASVNRGTFTLAEWTILPKKGVLSAFLDAHPRLRDWLARLVERKQAHKRIEEGFQVQDPDDEGALGLSTRPSNRIVNETQGQPPEFPEKLQVLESRHDLARQLATAIKRVAQDIRADPPKRYTYDEWLHFTKLIRFSSPRHNRWALPILEDCGEKEDEDEDEEVMELVEWDWIGEESPMLANLTESEWVLERLCESLHRYTRRAGRQGKARYSVNNRQPETIKEAADEGVSVQSPVLDEAKVKEWAEKMVSVDFPVLEYRGKKDASSGSYEQELQGP